MRYTLSLARRGICALLPATALLLASGFSSARAQSFPTARASLQFPRGSDRGAPIRTTGPASRRESCSAQHQQQAIPLTALTPANNIVTTIAANLSIYIYVPQLTDKQALFNVIDKQTEEVVYITTVSLESSPGILKLNLPETVELQPNITYEWRFFVHCDPNDPMADQFVRGWIERTALTVEKEAEVQQFDRSPLQQAQLYARAEVWNETLDLVARSRYSNPEAWIELLESVGLSREIAGSSFIER